MKTKYAHIREFIYGWDWTETDEHENVYLYDTKEEADKQLEIYIEDVNKEHEKGHLDFPYQEDCMVAEVQIRDGLITCEFIKEPFKIISLIRVNLKYSCGGNYKYFFDLTIPKEKVRGLKVGDEREIEEFGITPSEMYDITGVTYDSELDHNLVDVEEIETILQ